jgi:hypothetical protein
MALHAVLSGERLSGRRRQAEPNHAIDLHLLHHLGEGLVLATRDYELVELVDMSGSFQAPWVRTIGEVVLGRAPVGPPFSANARKVSAKHRARSRERLRGSDAEGEAIAMRAAQTAG